MACVNKTQSRAARGTQWSIEWPAQSSRATPEQCDATCPPSVCCAGPVCGSGCRCAPSDSTVHVVGPASCIPNPCCPGCQPEKCCRATYIDDGNGSCCPRDCCARGGDNGTCCPEAKPFCCEGDCQTVVPTPCPTSIGGGNPCEGDGRTFTVNVESGPCTLRIQALGNQLFPGGGIDSPNFAAKPEIVLMDGVPLPTAPVQPGTEGRWQSLSHTLDYCKPRGKNSLTFSVVQVRHYISGCAGVEAGNEGVIRGAECDCLPVSQFGDGGVPVVVNARAWDVTVQCISPCACDDEANPLP